MPIRLLFVLSALLVTGIMAGERLPLVYVVSSYNPVTFSWSREIEEGINGIPEGYLKSSKLNSLKNPGHNITGTYQRTL